MPIKSFLRFFLVSLIMFSNSYAQSDSALLKNIYNTALTEGKAYDNLRYLCKEIGNRLSGSENSLKAVHWSQEVLSSYGLDSVWLQEVYVPKWVRGDVEKAEVYLNGQWLSLNVSTLGGSISSNGSIEAPLIIVASIEELKTMDAEMVEGKIVLLNEALDATFIDTFQAYGKCGGQRFHGASEAAAKGALAVLTRSLTLAHDDHPHTGVMGYKDSTQMIPAMALATNDCDYLMSKNDTTLILRFETNPVFEGFVKSYNVIGELFGKERPDAYITFGGHLDSWDIGEGAHDDGAGVVQAMETIRLFKTLDIQNRYTLRCVLFMNEENGNRGGIGYAQRATALNENHVFALESDRGGFAPRGFTVKGSAEQVSFVQQFYPLLQPYLLHIFEAGYGGVDINPLKTDENFLVGFVPDSQRYFDYHHSALDVFENVNQRELELGAASMTALIMLLDRYLDQKLEKMD